MDINGQSIDQFADSPIKVEGIDMGGDNPAKGVGGVDINKSTDTKGSGGIKFPAKRDFLTYEITVDVPFTSAAVAANYPIFYIATVQCFLLEAKARWDVNSVSGVIDVEKLVDTTAKGSGVSMIATTFDTSTGARTTQRVLPTTTLANAQLAPGNAVALKASGTLTNASDLCVTLLFGVIAKNVPVSANV